MEKIRKIVLLGAGNMAGHLSKALVRCGLRLEEVMSRSPESGKRLARQLGARFIEKIEDLNQDADLYILAVNDSSIAQIAGTLRLKNKIVVHTSGTVGIDVLNPVSRKRGVFYPLQTFRKGKRIRFSNVPICIEADQAGVERTLLDLATRVSTSVHVITSEQRKILHLAAVFASNFTNYMYAVAEDLISQDDIPFDLLAPLIRQTASNIRHTGIFGLQTGPAIREEWAVIEQHLELLKDRKVYRDIYNLMTQSIIQQQHRNAKL